MLLRFVYCLLCIDHHSAMKLLSYIPTQRLGGSWSKFWSIDNFNSAYRDSYFVTKNQFYMFRGTGSKFFNYALLHNKNVLTICLFGIQNKNTICLYFLLLYTQESPWVVEGSLAHVDHPYFHVWHMISIGCHAPILCASKCFKIAVYLWWCPFRYYTA